MAINKKNSIKTNINIDSSGAQKGASQLFDKIKKGQKDVTKGATKASGATKKVGTASAVAGAKGATSFGFFSSALKAAKVSVLSMIPALGGLTAAIAATGIGAIVIAVAALGIAFAAAIRKGAQFGKALSALEAVSGSTSVEMSALKAQAKELGSTTVFTASEVVKLQTELAKLGFVATDIQKATPSILDLAASLDVDLASAAELAGSTVRSFGLETTETKRVVDAMAKSASSSAQNFASLVESFKLAAPTAKALGVTVEQTSAYLAALANSGLKGSIAGTGLSKTFIMLHKKGLTLSEGLERVRISSDGLNTAIDLVGIIGAKSLLTLANSKDDLELLNKELANTADGSIDAAKKMAEIKMDNLSGDVTRLASAWEGLILSVEDGSGILNGLSRGVIKGLTQAISNLTYVSQYLTFTFSDGWQSMKGYTKAAGDFIIGSFDVLGSTIKKFAFNAILAISEIPIIGKAIDKSALQTNLKVVESQLLAGNQRINQGVVELKRQHLRSLLKLNRFSEYQKGAELAATNSKQRREQEKIDLDQQIKAQEAAAKKLRDNAKEFVKFKENLKKEEEKQEADTAEKKIELDRTRQLKKLESLNQNAEEEQVVRDAINALYDAKQIEREKKLKEEKDIRDEITRQSEIDKQIELDALELERLLLNDQLKFDEREKLQLAFLEKKRLADLDNEKLTEKEIAIINKKAAKAYAPPMSLAMGALGAAGTVAPIIKGLAEIKKNRFSKGGKSSGGNVGGTINTSAITTAVGSGGITPDTISSLSANNAARLGIDPSIAAAAGSAATNNILGGTSASITFSESAYQSFRSQVSFVEEAITVGG